MCYTKYLLDPIWRRDGYDSIVMHAPIFAMYVGQTKVKEIRLKTLNLWTARILFIQPSEMRVMLAIKST